VTPAAAQAEPSARTGIAWGSVALWALTAIALAIRCANLAAQGFWFDEAYTHWISRLPAADAWRVVVADGVHPPLYYAIARAALLLGESEAALRFPSAVFGALTVPVVFWVGARWAGRATGWIAALLVAFSPIHVWYSTDARMYVLLAFLGAVVMLTYLTWLERPGGATSAALVGFSALAYLTHYFALFLPLIQFVHLALDLRQHPRAFRVWVGLQAAAVVPLLGWVYALSQREAQYFGIGWIPVPHLSDLFGTLVNFTSGLGGSPEWWQIVMAAACLLLAGLGLAAPWPMRRARLLAFLWAAGPVLVALGLSIRRPVYMDRFLLISLPALLLLIARGVTIVPRWAVAPGAAGLVALTVLAMVRFAFWPGQVREQWRDAARRLEQTEPDEAIVARVYQILVPLSYYYHGTVPIEAMEVNRQVTPLSELARGHEGVWLVYWNASADIHQVASAPAFRAQDEVDPEASAWLGGQGPPLRERVDFVGVTLLHFGASP
jgi:uncharacterized membrane protein